MRDLFSSVLPCLYSVVNFPMSEEVGRAQFNLATPIYATVAVSLHTAYGKYRMIHKRNSFKITSRVVQG